MKQAPHILFFDLRRRRRGSAPALAHHQHSCGQHSFKRWCTPSFRPSELFTKQRGTQTKRRNTLIPKKAHNVQTGTKIEGPRQANSNSKRSPRSLQRTHSRIIFRKFGPVAHTFFFLFSHHLSFHGPSTARKASICCDRFSRHPFLLLFRKPF